MLPPVLENALRGKQAPLEWGQSPEQVMLTLVLMTKSKL
jgi:hypothetical protein